VTDKMKVYCSFVDEFRKSVVVMSFNCSHTLHFSITVIALGSREEQYTTTCNGL
jgi:hypothetical protein